MKESIRQTLRAKDRLDLFVALTGEEFDALWGHAPMTQELFERVLRGLGALDNMDAIWAVMEAYPEFTARLREKIFVTGESNVFFP